MASIKHRASSTAAILYAIQKDMFYTIMLRLARGISIAPCPGPPGAAADTHQNCQRIEMLNKNHARQRARPDSRRRESWPAHFRLCTTAMHRTFATPHSSLSRFSGKNRVPGTGYARAPGWRVGLPRTCSCRARTAQHAPQTIQQPPPATSVAPFHPHAPARTAQTRACSAPTHQHAQHLGSR
jgi:hypothetical protein